jgi:hypothetical protein
VSPTFRRPTARVDLSDKEEEEEEDEDEDDEAQQGRGSDRHATLGAFEQQQPAGASADGGEGSSETGAAVEEQQQPPSHALSPATVEIFTHDEIVCLRLIFALFDDNGDDFVDQGELLRYAEETGAVARGLHLHMWLVIR